MSVGRSHRSVPAAARRWLEAWSLLVPAGRREDWLEEWEAELAELWRRAGRSPRRYGCRGPAVVRYLSGAP